MILQIVCPHRSHRLRFYRPRPRLWALWLGPLYLCWDRR